MSDVLKRMIQDSGMTEADYERSVAMGSKSAFARTSVTKSAELRRILALPRRVWEEKAQELVPALSEYLRAPGGTQTLRPVQAISLVEMHDFGGLLGIIRVGGGKCSEFDTEVFDASTGCRRMVGEIGAFAVPALQSEGLGAGRLEVAQAVAFASGRKECFELVLANGMSLRASFDHPVLTSNGWVWMRDLKEGISSRWQERSQNPPSRQQQPMKRFCSRRICWRTAAYPRITQFFATTTRRSPPKCEI